MFFYAGMLFHPLAKRCKLGKGTCNLIRLPRVCEQKLLKKPFFWMFLNVFNTASLKQYLFTIFFKQYPASLCRSVIQKPVKGESLGEEQNPWRTKPGKCQKTSNPPCVYSTEKRNRLGHLKRTLLQSRDAAALTVLRHQIQPALFDPALPSRHAGS